MEILFIVAILGLNGLISWWNCYVLGRNWLEVQHTGGWFMKAVMYSGAFQAVVGFSMISLFLLLGVASLVAPWMGIGEYTALLWEWSMSLWYIGIIVPALGTGYILTVHSWMVAYRERNLASMGGAAWNTFASAYNTYNAIQGMGQAFGSVGEMFGSLAEGGDNPQAKVAIFAIILVVLALISGVVITRALIKRYEGTVPLPERNEARA